MSVREATRDALPDLLGRDEVAIARRLALSARRSIGFLPVGVALGLAAKSHSGAGFELHFVTDVARALTDFVSGEVATVGPWRSWSAEPAGPAAPRRRRSRTREPEARAGAGAGHNLNDNDNDVVDNVDDVDSDDGGRVVAVPDEPRRVRLVPSEVGDRSAAGFALRRALTRHLPNLSRALIDLSDHAPPGVIPAVAERLDGVVLLVRVRRDRWQRVAEMTRMLPASQNLGVILLG